MFQTLQAGRFTEKVSGEFVTLILISSAMKLIHQLCVFQCPYRPSYRITSSKRAPIYVAMPVMIPNNGILI